MIKKRNEGTFGFIISCPFFMPVASIKMNITEELSDKAVIVSFKETKTKIQNSKFKQRRQKYWKEMNSKYLKENKHNQSTQ